MADAAVCRQAHGRNGRLVNGHATLREVDSPYEALAGMKEPPLPATAMERLLQALRRANGVRVGVEDSWTCRRLGQSRFDDVYLLRPPEAVEEFVLRIASQAQLSACGRKWIHDKMLSESKAVRLLGAHGLPVPRLLVTCCDLNLFMDCCKSGRSETLTVAGLDYHGRPCIVEQRLPGTPLESDFDSLSDESQARICREYTAFALRLSRVGVPQDQGIGSIRCFEPERGAVTIGPFRDLPAAGSPQGDAHRGLLLMTAGRPFVDDLAFLRAYAGVSRLSALHHSALFGIEGLLRFLRPPPVDAVCHRLVFHRLGGSPEDLFVENGSLRGVGGFDCHAIVPLYFAAGEPACLQPEGDFGKYSLIDGQDPDSHEEDRRQALALRREFQRAAKELDPDFHHAMTWGRPLRQLIQWLRGWSADETYVEAFSRWRARVENFDALEALVADTEPTDAAMSS